MKKFILPILLIMLLAGFKSAFNRTITGTVTSAGDGLPIPGVSIRVKGGTGGVVSGANGYYRINVNEKATVLIFEYIGYKPVEITIGKKAVVNVTLQTDENVLETVEVIGLSGTKQTPRSDMAQRKARMQQEIAATQRNLKASKMMVMAAPVQNQESYASFTENKFHSAKHDPLSTFSIDVDAASYGNIRRMINDGALPPADAVRIEEMINYFDYDYPQPAGSDPVNIITEVGPAPWNNKHQLVQIGLQAKTISSENLPASNLVFLIDVSGSMGAQNKLPLLVSSFKLLTDQLRKKDKVAIVVYAGSSGVVLPATNGHETTKIKDALQKLEAGGSTAGGEGIQLAYKIARENFIDGGNNRVILATDGDFNVGASSDKDMETLIEKERKSGVFLTVLGFGMGNYKDSKMEILADKGNGNYAYIDNISEARKVLVKEFGGTIYTVAKDVKLQVEFNPAHVAAYRLVGYENRMLAKEDFNNDEKDAGEIGSGHTVTALYEIIPVGVKSDFISVDPLKYQNNTSSGNQNELLTVKIRYKQPDGNTSKLLSKPVLKSTVTASTENFRFAAAVAEFGMLLRKSEFKQNASYDQVIELASQAMGKDPEGYRHEFLSLVRSAKLLAVDLLTLKDKKIMDEKN